MTTMRKLPRTAMTFSPPVMEARRWLDGVTHPADRPLINVSQAAPVDAPPQPMLEAMAQIVLTDPSAHLYGPCAGGDYFWLQPSFCRRDFNALR
jgi:hypothetical protein